MNRYWLFAVIVCAACGEAGDYPELLTTRSEKPLVFADPDKDCAGCHPQHVAEWRISNHAYAAKDPVFIAMTKVAQRQTRGKVDQFCTNCHMPVAAAYGLTPVVFDEQTRVFKQDVVNLPESVKKGVTCDVCHSVVSIVDTRNAKLELKPDGNQRGTIRDPIPTAAHQSTYSELHASSRLCSSCHAVVNGKGALLEQTFDEWTFSNAANEGQQCQDCHMPSYVGSAAKDGPDRLVHDHTFVGVDVSLLPEDEFPGYWELRKKTAELLSTAAVMDAKFMDAQGQLQVRISNRTGHGLPTGATADRQMWLRIKVLDSDGNLLFESGTLDENLDIRDGIDGHSERPGTDPQLAYFGQLLLESRQLNTASTEQERTQIRAQLTAGCRPIGQGGHTDFSDDLKAGAFPWNANWQCDYMLKPDETVDVKYDLTALHGSPAKISVELLYRTFPPYLLRKLERLGGLDRAVKGRLPIVTMAAKTIIVPNAD
ncbi:MAG: multiheme c-type cytochrome [Myxococcota bacterium]|nr:multiheme c-type cytochrome [Myxococcota bacterium]